MQPNPFSRGDFSYGSTKCKCAFLIKHDDAQSDRESDSEGHRR